MGPAAGGGRSGRGDLQGLENQGPSQLPDLLSLWRVREAHPPIAFPAGLSGSEALERLLLIPRSLLRR